MGEVTSGLRQLLAIPRIYSKVQQAVARPGNRKEIAQRYIRARPGDRIIDIGCGPADLLAVLPPVEYHGFDRNPDYISQARASFGAQATFYEADVADLAGRFRGAADVVIAAGLIHHLDDAAARALFATARSMLKPRGRMVTIDPVRTERQHPLARLAIRLDRGQHVRTVDGQRALAAAAFPAIQSHVRTDLMRIPYTHLILECADACDG